MGYDIRNYRNHTYTNKVIGDALGSGSASRTIYTYQTLTFNQLINYKRSFNSHNFELLEAMRVINIIMIIYMDIKEIKL